MKTSLYVLILAFVSFTQSAYAGIPVFDGSNLLQQIQQVIAWGEQLSGMAQQYQQQVQQYENMVKNTMNPSSFDWGNTQGTIDQLLANANALEQMKQQAGSLNLYLDSFKNTAEYKNHPCFSSSGCTSVQQAELNSQEAAALSSQKQANDALLRSIENQQASLRRDAAQLSRLQSGSQGADGQQKAIQYGNQIASQQAQQLMEIRGMLLAQHTATAIKSQRDTAIDAKDKALNDRMWNFNYQPSSPDRY